MFDDWVSLLKRTTVYWDRILFAWTLTRIEPCRTVHAASQWRFRCDRSCSFVEYRPRMSSAIERTGRTCNFSSHKSIPRWTIELLMEHDRRQRHESIPSKDLESISRTATWTGHGSRTRQPCSKSKHPAGRHGHRHLCFTFCSLLLLDVNLTNVWRNAIILALASRCSRWQLGMMCSMMAPITLDFR